MKIHETNIDRHLVTISLLKKGIWLYFFLLIFEGALRKWAFPSLASPLLLVRDPIAIVLIFMTWKNGLLPRNLYLSWLVIIGIVGILTAVFVGHGNIYVAFYGARILLIHIPLIFVFGSIFDHDDVIKIGKASFWIALPMVILIGLQFYSPQSAWVNRGVGGNEGGAGFEGALGYFRPSGTFSFTNGTSLFFSFLAVYVFYFWIKKSDVSRLLLIIATAALLIAIPLSISRGLLFQVILTLVFTILAISQKTEHLTKLIIAIVIGISVLKILGNISFFQTATEVFTSRFDDANQIEGGLEGVFIDRFLGGMISALVESDQLPFWGFGIGMGTNVGSMLLSGKITFLIAEGEWGRIIGEQGPLLGVGIVLIRVSLVFTIGIAAFKQLSKGNILPWILLSFGFLHIMQGQWAQPTSLGFCVLIGGLVIASLKT